jgi:hypothetical protein
MVMHMSKEKLRDVREHITLYKDSGTGIAWVENGTAGVRHSCHPNISSTGSVRGMKDRGHWAADARTVRAAGFIYNIDAWVVSDELDAIAAQHCRCGGKHPTAGRATPLETIAQ